MEWTLKWVSVEDELPPPNTQVALIYKKGSKSVGRGKTGTFVTQGSLCITPPTAWRTVEERIFSDYTNRQIQDMASPSSNNKVTHWATMGELPIDN